MTELKGNHRGKGYGKKAMHLFEEDVKQRGVKRTGLHVFGFNKAAAGLYQSIGYEITDLSMQKELS
ncbi:GNAT family N-acetyltransferase [bacterium]|jgi:ribosomal protein S18 acetylase RimI-like enzyme|nr:GNAT family N-acetyltransferase [bacterium]